MRGIEGRIVTLCERVLTTVNIGSAYPAASGNTLANIAASLTVVGDNNDVLNITDSATTTARYRATPRTDAGCPGKAMVPTGTSFPPEIRKTCRFLSM